MIIYALLELFVLVLGGVLSILNVIPGISTLNNAIQPYLDSLTTVINSGANLIGFFVPISLLKILIPIVIVVELAVENFDIIKFVLKKIINR